MALPAPGAGHAGAAGGAVGRAPPPRLVAGAAATHAGDAARAADGVRLPRHAHQPGAGGGAGAAVGLHGPGLHRAGRRAARRGRRDVARAAADRGRELGADRRLRGRPPDSAPGLRRGDGAGGRRVARRERGLARGRSGVSRRAVVAGLPRAHDRGRAAGAEPDALPRAARPAAVPAPHGAVCSPRSS